MKLSRLARFGGATVAVLTITSAAAVVLYSRDAQSTAGAGTRNAPVATVTIKKTNLTTSFTASGEVGYGAPRPLKGPGEGKVTWLPSVGTVVPRGGQLMRIDDQPVILMYGVTPLFRSLSTTGMVGSDVKVVADNLKALGYSIGRQPAVGATIPQPAAPAGSGPSSAAATAVADAPKAAAGAASTPPTAAASPPPLIVRKGDAVLTSALVAAIKKWQRRVGLRRTGVIDPVNVAVEAQQVRVTAVAARIGASAAEDVLTVSSTAKVVTAKVSPSDGAAAKPRQQVIVTMPDGSTSKGTIRTVSAATSTADDPGSDPQLTVSITVDDPAAIKSFDAGAVQVEFTADKREGVLAVPVGALLALSEGGYAVQVPGGQLIAVETGIYAKGMVEISGAGLSDGVQIVTAS